MDTEALLGPLPLGWRIHHLVDWMGDAVQVFTDTQTGTVVYDDPRLGALPDDWEFKKAYDPGTSEMRYFINRSTSAERWEDPRLAPDALRTRGVPVQRIHLV